jgi:cytoskeletal protein CcmA (bactofilin family)
MWNRRKEEENTYTKPASVPPTAAPPTSSELAKEGIPMSTLPGRSNVSEPHHEPHRGGNAVLGKSVIVKGQIFSREDLTIDGEVEGTVDLQEHRLTVGPNGKVVASVKAREVVVLGTIHGNVETSDKIDIRRDAKLVGDLRTARIVIEDGAYFKGNIDIIRADAKPEPKQAPKPQPVANSTAPAMAAGAGDNKR